MCVEHMYIEHDGDLMMFENKKMDSRMFEARCWFVAKALKTGMPIAHVEALADIWVHKRFLGVSYPESVERHIQTVLNTCSGNLQSP